MRTIITLVCLLSLVCFAQGQVTNPPTIPPTAPLIQQGTDVIVMSGATYNYLAKQAASLTSISLKIASIGGLPTYATSTYQTASINLNKGIANSLTATAGITQIIWQPMPTLAAWVETTAGITGISVANLGTIQGAVGIAWDAGSKFTGGKYHVYVCPLFREVDVASLQVKPVYAIQIGTGFKK